MDSVEAAQAEAVLNKVSCLLVVEGEVSGVAVDPEGLHHSNGLVHPGSRFFGRHSPIQGVNCTCAGAAAAIEEASSLTLEFGGALCCSAVGCWSATGYVSLNLADH